MQIVFFKSTENSGEISFGDIFSSRQVYNPVIRAFNSFSYYKSVNLAMPDKLRSADTLNLRHLRISDDRIALDMLQLDRQVSEWIIISDGRYVTKIDWDKIIKIAGRSNKDVVSINVSHGYSGYHEKILIHGRSNAVGFRRFYNDSVCFSSKPSKWPHHLMIRSSVFNDILENKNLCLEFDKLLETCRGKSISTGSIETGGKIADITGESGLLDIYRYMTDSRSVPHWIPVNAPASSRIIGHVSFGKNYQIDEEAVITGPAVISDNVRIGKKAVVSRSIIGFGINVPDNRILRNRAVFRKDYLDAKQNDTADFQYSFTSTESYEFKKWPWYSYPRLGKRILDIIFSLIILSLFIPFFFIVAVVIKLTSKGPVFYVARRQGLGGREFGCIKFRSMMVEAEDLQEKLRIVNEVDGPQFKMKHDPRIDGVGKFLRDTCIDEIPQFINVLKGDMSVVGPRPSPETENTTCPWWRYARLSVKPGITGLWQIKRTRDESRDFQEWLIYDTEYVKKLSFRFDVYIAYKTAQKLINDFLEQF